MKNDKWSGILVYIENHGQIVHPVGLELIGEANRLAKQSGEKVYTIAIGENIERIEEQLMGYPIEKVWLYELEGEFQSDRYEEPMEACIRKLKPAIVLMGGTYEGRALAPRVAVSFKTGLTADCTELQMTKNGDLLQIRPAFGGNIMASILTEQTRPQFATVRPHIFPMIQKSQVYAPQFCINNYKSTKKCFTVLSAESIKEVSGIADQNVLVVAGRGVRKKEDLEMLHELATRLGGKLASSRALVEKGWMLPQEQIGLSGISVTPKCMITCGVSGTVQFQVGMKSTQNIIAINTDPKARIFEIAHYPICADLYEVIPQLLKQLVDLKEKEKR